MQRLPSDGKQAAQNQTNTMDMAPNRLPTL
jgi:hypothetical protein